MLLLKLLAAEMIVVSLLIKKFLMFALLDDLPVADHKDQIRVADGGQAVGDNKGSTAMEKFLCGLLNELLGLGVNGGCGLV